MKLLRLLCATLVSTAILNLLQIPMPLQSSEMLIDSAAYAKRSGGRSGGGSFSSPSSGGSRSSGGSSRSRGSDSGGTARSSGGGVYYGDSSDDDAIRRGNDMTSAVIVALILAYGGRSFVRSLLKASLGNRSKLGENIVHTAAGHARTVEFENDIVTITKVQVGLLAEGRAIQHQLAEIVQQADTETVEGLHAELQEAALALLRMPENWSHVQASSETVKTRDEAEKRFNQWSIAERTKYTTETLTNANGKLVQKEFELDPDKDPASYIVVTLIVGTADDKPLFSEIRTAEALKDILYQLSSLNPEYLMRFELQWTPQVEGDRLTYDEMLLEYTEMLQI